MFKGQNIIYMTNSTVICVPVYVNEVEKHDFYPWSICQFKSYNLFYQRAVNKKKIMLLFNWLNL